MSKESDLFDKAGPDMAFALMNLWALQACVSAPDAPILDLVRDVQTQLERYSGCNQTDIEKAYSQYFKGMGV